LKKLWTIRILPYYEVGKADNSQETFDAMYSRWKNSATGLIEAWFIEKNTNQNTASGVANVGNFRNVKCPAKSGSRNIRIPSYRHGGKKKGSYQFEERLRTKNLQTFETRTSQQIPVEPNSGCTQNVIPTRSQGAPLNRQLILADANRRAASPLRKTCVNFNAKNGLIYSESKNKSAKREGNCRRQFFPPL
jgi:hypothetical protein